MTLNLVTAPTSEPVAVDLVRTQCRVDGTDEDALLQNYVAASRELVEATTGRQLITATWALVLDCFPCFIDVPKAPLRSVTSITYVDTAGVTQTLAPSNYRVTGAVSDPVNPTAARARIHPAYGQYWPSTLWERETVTVTFVAGYGTADKVPMALVQACLLLNSHWYRNREPVSIGIGVAALEIPFAVEALLGPYRTWPIEEPRYAGSWDRRWPPR